MTYTNDYDNLVRRDEEIKPSKKGNPIRILKRCRIFGRPDNNRLTRVAYHTDRYTPCVKDSLGNTASKAPKHS